MLKASPIRPSLFRDKSHFLSQPRLCEGSSCISHMTAIANCRARAKGPFITSQPGPGTGMHPGGRSLTWGHTPMPKALLSAIWCRFSSVLEERIGSEGLPMPEAESRRVPLQGHTPAAPGHTTVYPSSITVCTRASLHNYPMLRPHTVLPRKGLGFQSQNVSNIPQPLCRAQAPGVLSTPKPSLSALAGASHWALFIPLPQLVQVLT